MSLLARAASSTAPRLGGLLFVCLLAAGCEQQPGSSEAAAPDQAAANPAAADPAAAHHEPGSQVAADTAAPEGVGADGEVVGPVVRVEKQSDNRGRLETAIVRYRRDDGAELDVIAVLHIADGPYYATLEERFRDYDALLYEMIKPTDADPTQRAGGSPVSMLQQMMCRMLGLEFQLDQIDYGAGNFVHADMTPEDFARRWDERDESVWKLMLRAMAAGGFASGNNMTPDQIVQMVRSPDRRSRLKLVMASVFAEADNLLGGLAAPDAEGRDQSMLIGERNLVALQVVERELDAGKRRLGLFYGAGHVPDFDVRLRKEHGFRRIGTEWLTAWDVRPPLADGEQR